MEANTRQLKQSQVAQQAHPAIAVPKASSLSSLLISRPPFPIKLNALFTALRFLRLIFIEPPASVTAPDQRRHARFIAGTLLFILAFGFAIEFVIEPIFSGALSAGWYDFGTITLSSFVTVAVAAVAYVLARTRYFQLGALLFILAFNVVIFWSYVENPDLYSFALLPYLIIPVLMFSIFGGLWITILFAVSNAVALIIIPNLLTPQTSLQTDLNISILLFYALVAVILTVSVKHRDTLEQDRRQKLAESEKRYKTLSETVFEGIALVRDGQIISTNAGFAHTFGHKTKEVEKQPLLRFIPDFDLASIYAQASPVEPPLVETTGLRQNGERVEIEIIVNQHLTDGQALYMLAVRDMTERNRIQEALQQAQRLDSIGVLAGGVAHDFNNMLTAISSQIFLTQRNLPAESSLQAYMEKAAQSVQGASALAQQLLTYAGKGHFEKQIVDLNQVLQKTLSFTTTTLPSGIRLDLERTSVPLPILADSSQIQQIVMNLVINAGEAIESGLGEIDVSTKQIRVEDTFKAARFVSKEPLAIGDYALLSVRDTGKGISAADRARIFDPFFTTKKTGNGLGLAATLGAIQAHGGGVAVRSAEGKGTLFEVIFPLAEGVIEQPPVAAVEQAQGSIIKQQTEADSPATQSAGKTPTVLVIDDEALVREVTVEILELFDFRVLMASNGYEGVECFRKHRDEIDLAILDMRMPGLNGEETLRELQSIEPRLKVLLSTGYTSHETLARLMQKGMVELLQKPYDLEMLTNKVQNLLDSAPVD